MTSRRFFRSLRGVRLRTILAAAIVLAPTVVTHPGRAVTTTDVALNNGLLTVNLRNVSRGKALSLVADLADFTVVLNDGFKERIDLAFSGVPLEKAFRLLAEPHSVAILYGIDTARQPDGGPLKIEKAWVVRTGRDQGSAGFAPQPEAGQPPDRGVVDQVLNDLGYREGESGERILSQVGQFDDLTAVLLLGKILEHEETPGIKEAAIDHLSGIGGAPAVQAIATALGDESVDVRRRAVESLAGVEDVAAIQILGQAVIGDADAAVRIAAVQALADKDSPAARAFLSTAAEDRDEGVRQAARSVLGREP